MRSRILAAAAVAAFVLAGCSSSDSGSSATTAAGTTAGATTAAATTAAATTAPAKTTAAPTTAAATTAAATTAPATTSGGGGGNTIGVTLGDTQGTNGPMTLVPTDAKAKAGSVTFDVKNTGTIDHEMAVLKTDTPYDKLPIGSDDKVSEDASVGETGDPAMKPGETRPVTLDLQPGRYVLVCNIAKHYGLGMRSEFTVTP